MKKITFIYNPKTKKSHLFKKEKVLNMFSGNEYEVVFLESEYHKHSIELSQQAVENGTDIIVAVGGTGTVNQVLQSIIGYNTTLAIFPTGNGNGLSNYIDLPQKFDDFLTTLKQGITASIDYGEVRLNDGTSKYFLSFFGMGASPHIAKECEGVAYQYYFPYIIKAYQFLWSYKPTDLFKLSFNHFNETRNFYEVFIGNIPSFRGRLSHNKYQSVKDGTFSISILDHINYRTVLEHGMKLLFKTNDNLYKLSDIHQASNIYITVNKNTPLQVDFEPFTASGELSIINHKQQVQLIIPEHIKFL